MSIAGVVKSIKNDGCHLTGCRLAAASAGNASQKPPISCAKRSATAACSASRSSSLTCRQHEPTTPARYHALHNGRSVGITLSTEPREVQRAFGRYHPQHNGLPSHALHNELSAQRAFEPRRHNGHRHDGGGTTRVQDARLVSSISKKVWESRCHGGRTEKLSRRCALPKRSKCARSCARSGRLQRGLGGEAR